MIKKIIIKNLLIFLLFFNAVANANDISSMSDISEAAGSSAQAAADLAAKKIASERALSSALKEIDEATNFIDKSYKEGDIDGALAAIALVEVAVSDVSKAIPSEFKSEIIKQGKEF